MYCELFKLREPPFRLTPDPQFLFASKQHARAKAYMESTIWLADGFVVITGEIGSGKTTLIEAMINQELGEPFRRDAMKKPVEVAGISAADMRPQVLA